jgi:predicted dehydrogenase
VFESSRGGGWVRVFGSHNLDFIRWTFGEIVDASAVLRTTVTERADSEGNMHECTAEDGFTATMRTDQGVSAVVDATSTGGVDRPTRVAVVGSRGVMEMLSESTHEIGGRIVLHTEDGTVEAFQMDPWADPASHDNQMMRPWAKLVRDAVLDGKADPIMPTFADGLACARVMDKLTSRP